MTDLSETLKDFEIPNAEDISVKDVEIINKFLEQRDPLFIIALILRIIGRDNELEKVNNDLVSVVNDHEKKINELKEKISKIYISEKSEKLRH